MLRAATQRNLSVAKLISLSPLRSAQQGHRPRARVQQRAVRSMATPYDAENIFRKIIDGKIPCYKLFETEHALAFLDAFPMARGHSLLVPKASGYADIYSMPPDVAAAVLCELPRLARAVKEATGCEGVNIVQNNGGAAGQVVFHLHFHVIPRFTGDGVVRLGAHGASGQMIDPTLAKEVQAAISAAL